MGRSRSFASATDNTYALFRLGFPLATARKALTGYRRQLAGSLCKRHAVTHERAPTACKHTVSGSLSSARRGSSHLSLALLSSLSVVREYLALRDGPRRFSRDSTWPDLLRYPPRDSGSFTYGTVTLCGAPFHMLLLDRCLVTLMWRTLQPRRENPRGLGSSAFARRY
jgi:hypothetical protein